MKQMRNILSGLLLITASSLLAQAPSWDIKPNAFQYNMTVTATLDLNCEELTKASNKLAAFVDGNLRGTAHTSNVINGKYMTTMSVYSNAASGETVTFRFYNIDTDSIYYSIDSVEFQDNAIYGTLQVPYVVKTNNTPTSIVLSKDSIKENKASGQLVGVLSTEDLDAKQTHTYHFVNDSTGYDNNSFSINGNQLIANFTADFGMKTTYKIRLKTTDNYGCSFEKEIVIYVDNNNHGPKAAETNGLISAASYFSPNGDGYNDYWQIQNIDLYANYKLLIFSTNGGIVFEQSSNYNNDWDGTINGNQLPEGVYYYYLQDNDNSKNSYKGTITLKR